MLDPVTPHYADKDLLHYGQPFQLTTNPSIRVDDQFGECTILVHSWVVGTGCWVCFGAVVPWGGRGVLVPGLAPPRWAHRLDLV